MNHEFVTRGRAYWYCLLTLGALLFACSRTVVAADDPSVPSGFLAYPPYNGFVFEAFHLLPARYDHLTVVEVDDYILYRGMGDVTLSAAASYDDVGRQKKMRDEALAKQQNETAVPASVAGEFKAMQAAANGDAAYAIGKDLPAAIRLYTAGAADFHIAHPTVVERQADAYSSPGSAASGPLDTEQQTALDNAIARFQAVLELPDTVKAPRAVAAAYMLGRSYALRNKPGDAVMAERAFVMTRTLARAGMPDPDGLAVASFGDQARLRRAQGDLASTVGLYAEQATRGSVEGVESLKWVAQALYDDPDGMSKVENIPLAQRLLIAYALEKNDDGRARDYVYSPGEHLPTVVDNGSMDLLVKAAKQWPKEKIAWPDRLAALAYRTGDVDFVHALIDDKNTPLAWWLQAKLFVADGKLAEAEAAYKKAVAISGATPDPTGLSPFNEKAVCAEMTQLERTRGEFVSALRDQVACDRIYAGVASNNIISYLAERVLTTAELQAFVTPLPADPPVNSTRVIDSDSEILHSELAKRLIREGRYDEALRYADKVHDIRVRKDDPSFDTGLSDDLKTQYDLIKAYGAARDQVAHADSADARASAWYQLALLTRVQHDAILDHDSDVVVKEPTPIFPGVSSRELTRLKQNYAMPDQDGLRWYIAYDDALKAAQLLPPRSQAYAATLCHAARWMNQAPPGSINGRDPLTDLHKAWQLYVKHGAYVAWTEDFGHRCPNPGFDTAAQPPWIHQLKALIKKFHVHPLTAIAMAIGAAGLAFALFGWLMWKRHS